MFLVINDDEVNVWAFCQFVFAKESSYLKEKPKIFIVQACRKTKPTQTTETTETTQTVSEDNVICLRRDERFIHYQFLFSCQPGELCGRGLLIKSLAEIIPRYSYEMHIDDIWKKVLQKFMKTPNQMPQILGTLPYYLNIFPGITKNQLETNEILSAPVQESNISTTIKHLLENVPDADHIGIKLPYGGHTLPVEVNSLMADKTNILVSNGTTGITDPKCKETKGTKNSIQEKDEKHFGISSKAQKVDKMDNHEHRLRLTIKQTIPDTEENKENAERMMYENLKQPEKQGEVAKYLSDELEAAVRVVGVSEGSVIIHIALDNEETVVKRLVFMSDTGLLSTLLQMFLVTPEFEDSCTAKNVKIKVVLDTTDMKPLPTVFEEISSKFPVRGNRVIITCPSLSDKKQEMWSKDGEQLESKDRLKLTNDGGRCQLQILNTVNTDDGRYKCEYMGLDKRKHITECSVVMLDKLKPPWSVWVENSYCYSADICWSKTFSPQCSYEVKYWLQSNENEVFSRLSKDIRLTINDLTPGEMYKLTVSCVPNSDTDPLYRESDAVPSEGCTFYTKPNPPAVTSIKKIYPDQVELRWEKPKHNMRFNVGVTAEASRFKRLPKPVVADVSDDSCTALVKNIFPFINYSFEVWFLFENQASERKTFLELCAAPCYIHIKDKTKNSVTVGWNWMRVKNDVFVTGYNIECIPQETDHGQIITLQSIRKPLDAQNCWGKELQNLKPDTEYEIRFTPLDCMSKPLSQNVKTIKVRTNSILLKPTDIEIQQKTTDGVPVLEITWTPVEGKNTDYIVRYWVYDENDRLQSHRRKHFGMETENRRNETHILVQSANPSVTLYNLE